jgi:hypothetical protein
MLPTFIGIGAPKAGTTWIHRLLASHPDVVMPAHRKEIHYFDLNYDRGARWYEGFFPVGATSAAAVGEFTPHYMYDPAVPLRVRSVPSIERFLVILRNPVDRAFSHFKFRGRQDNRAESFPAFLQREPQALAWGLYGHHLADWFAAFGREPFLILVFEQAVAAPGDTMERLARHLGLDVDRFPADAGARPANEGAIPRRRRAYSTAVRQARWLRRHELDRVITVAKRLGVVDALKRPAPSSQLAETVSPEVRLELWRKFAPDVGLLEDLTGIDLSAWRPGAA